MYRKLLVAIVEHIGLVIKGGRGPIWLWPYSILLRVKWLIWMVHRTHNRNNWSDKTISHNNCHYWCTGTATCHSPCFFVDWLSYQRCYSMRSSVLLMYSYCSLTVRHFSFKHRILLWPLNWYSLRQSLMQSFWR